MYFKENGDLYSLQPIYENVRSYYKKAKVEEYHYNPYSVRDKQLILYSYSLKVATITEKDNKIVAVEVYDKDLYSATTTRHIKEFFKQNNVPFKDKKDIVKRYYFDKNALVEQFQYGTTQIYIR